jgi:hypothetical protein
VSDEPLRLKRAEATSPELAHSLWAPGRSSDVDRLARVANELSASLQPTAAAGGGVRTATDSMDRAS